jgi:hypothetical protein
MTGWLGVAAVIIVEAAILLALVRCGVRDWTVAAVMLVTAALLVRPALSVTGDVSRYLPGWLFSDGAEGKDQIVIASAASTLLLALIGAAALACAWRRFNERS